MDIYLNSNFPGYSQKTTKVLRTAFSAIHYENTPIQIYRKFHLKKKTENFQIKNSDIFLISAQNIDCGYSLEPPQRGGSNKYPQAIEAVLTSTHNLCF